jgi:hypothetical protein
MTFSWKWFAGAKPPRSAAHESPHNPDVFDRATCKILITSKFIKRYLGFESLSLRHGVLPAENLRAICSNNRENCRISAIFRPEKLPEKKLNHAGRGVGCPIFSDPHFRGLFSQPPNGRIVCDTKANVKRCAFADSSFVGGMPIVASRTRLSLVSG